MILSAKAKASISISSLVNRFDFEWKRDKDLHPGSWPGLHLTYPYMTQGRRAASLESQGRHAPRYKARRREDSSVIDTALPLRDAIQAVFRNFNMGNRVRGNDDLLRQLEDWRVNGKIPVGWSREGLQSLMQFRDRIIETLGSLADEIVIKTPEETAKPVIEVETIAPAEPLVVPPLNGASKSKIVAAHVRPSRPTSQVLAAESEPIAAVVTTTPDKLKPTTQRIDDDIAALREGALQILKNQCLAFSYLRESNQQLQALMVRIDALASKTDKPEMSIEEFEAEAARRLAEIDIPPFEEHKWRGLKLDTKRQLVAYCDFLKTRYGYLAKFLVENHFKPSAPSQWRHEIAVSDAQAELNGVEAEEIEIPALQNGSAAEVPKGLPVPPADTPDIQNDENEAEIARLKQRLSLQPFVAGERRFLTDNQVLDGDELCTRLRKKRGGLRTFLIENNLEPNTPTRWATRAARIRAAQANGEIETTSEYDSDTEEAESVLGEPLQAAAYENRPWRHKAREASADEIGQQPDEAGLVEDAVVENVMDDAAFEAEAAGQQADMNLPVFVEGRRRHWSDDMKRKVIEHYDFLKAKKGRRGAFLVANHISATFIPLWRRDLERLDQQNGTVAKNAPPVVRTSARAGRPPKNRNDIPDEQFADAFEDDAEEEIGDLPADADADEDQWEEPVARQPVRRVSRRAHQLQDYDGPSDGTWHEVRTNVSPTRPLNLTMAAWEASFTDARTHAQRRTLLAEIQQLRGDGPALAAFYKRNDVVPGDILKWIRLYAAEPQQAVQSTVVVRTQRPVGEILSIVGDALCDVDAMQNSLEVQTRGSMSSRQTYQSMVLTRMRTLPTHRADRLTELAAIMTLTASQAAEWKELVCEKFGIRGKAGEEFAEMLRLPAGLRDEAQQRRFEALVQNIWPCSL